jgi:zinc transporter ZupT
VRAIIFCTSHRSRCNDPGWVVCDSEAIQIGTRIGLTVVGFLIFYLGQRFLSLQHCPDGDCGPDRHVGRMSALGLIAHSTMDGASIAASTMISWRMGLIVAVGIIVHDITDGLNTILLVTRGDSASKKDLAFLVADAAAPVLGGTVVVLAGLPSHQLALILGVTSGFFLFTATGDLLPDAHRRSPGFGVSAAALGGILLIGIAVRLASISRDSSQNSPLFQGFLASLVVNTPGTILAYSGLMT